MINGRKLLGIIAASLLLFTACDNGGHKKKNLKQQKKNFVKTIQRKVDSLQVKINQLHFQADSAADSNKKVFRRAWKRIEANNKNLNDSLKHFKKKANKNWQKLRINLKKGWQKLKNEVDSIHIHHKADSTGS